MVKKILILIVLACYLTLPLIAADKIVVLDTDDFQVWWLEDIQEKLVDVYINNQIPYTLAVIPAGLTDPWGSGDRLIERIQKWDAEPFIEVTQHGYDHEVYLESMSYSQQYNRIKNGNDLMISKTGVTPKSFIPPFGSADSNTVKAVKALGFHTFYNPVEMSPTSDDDMLIIQDQILLCKNGDEGRNCQFKDYNTLKSQINSKIDEGGVALVLNHMQDFESNDGNFDTTKANQIVDYANNLKNDGYTLMTVEQYYQHLNSNPEETDSDNDGYTTETDCDDSDSNIHPGANDNNCNGIDENCNNVADEGYVETTTSCGIGACESDGLIQCVLGTEVDSCSPLTPTTEICDSIDNDCDGSIDEGEVCVVETDNDNDGYDVSVDCDDSDSNINPGAEENCQNNLDDDCDNYVDLNDLECQQFCLSFLDQYLNSRPLNEVGSSSVSTTIHV